MEDAEFACSLRATVEEVFFCLRMVLRHIVLCNQNSRMMNISNTLPFEMTISITWIVTS